MGATDLQQSIIDAMQLVSSKTVDSTNAPVVIKGEILEELDDSTHQYSISYNNNIYKDVYTIANAKYSVSTIVYVLIPDGNYDNTKWILGSVEPEASTFVTDSDYDIYTPVSSNLLDEINIWGNEIKLRTWANETKDFGTELKKEKNVNKYQNFIKLFKEYLIKYRTFVFSALIKTDIDMNHWNQGDYGLKMEIPIINTKTKATKKQVVDMTTYNIEGDSYNFDLFQRVDIYFSLNEEWTCDVNNLSDFTFIAYTKDFVYDENEIIDKEYDIIIKDISLKMLDELPETKRNGYYVKLVSSDGNYFLAGVYATKKTLTPILKINGKEASLKDWDCYWFIEDYSIETNSEEYMEFAGPGWKCMNERKELGQTSEGKKLFQYVKNTYSMDVSPSAVSVESKYRCYLIKTITKSNNDTETIIVYDEILLKNLDSNISLSLTTVTGSNVFAENIGNVELIARIETGDKMFDNNIGYDIVWKRFDKNNNAISEGIFYKITKPLSFISVREEVKKDSSLTDKYYTYEMRISYPCSNIDISNTVYCTFYKKIDSNRANLGSRSILITTAKNLGYTLKILNGDVLYKYNSTGDAPTIGNYDGPHSSEINVIKPFSFQIFKPDGYELTEDEYKQVTSWKWFISQHSLIKPKNYTGTWTDTDGDGEIYYVLENVAQVNYTIAEQYNKRFANNNTVRLEVNYDNNELVEVANPIFIKDGEGGTNGSRYTSIIKYKFDPNKEARGYEEKDENNIYRKLHLVWVQNKTAWYYHDQSENTLVEMPIYDDRDKEKGLSFISEFWRDGERLEDQSIKTIRREWRLFDVENKNSQNKKNCFHIEEKTGKFTVAKTNAAWERNKIPWTIIQCKTTVTSESGIVAGISNQEIIHSYYPIEVTYIENYNFNSQNPPMLPSLRGGFDEVLYDIDGNNPDYDQEMLYIKNSALSGRYNFVCENDIENLESHKEGLTQAYKYEWKCSSENLKVESQNGKYAKIKPNVRFQSGIGFNYIRVDYEWDDNSRQPINDMIQKLNNQIKNAETKRTMYIGNYIEKKNSQGKGIGNYKREEYSTTTDPKIKDYKYIYIGDGNQDYEVSTRGNRQYITFIYDNYGKENVWNGELLKTKRSTSFLNNINTSLVNLDKMIEVLRKIYNFSKKNKLLINEEGIGYVNGTNLTTLINTITEARKALYFLGLGSYNLSSLVPMGNYIYLTEVISNENKNALSAGGPTKQSYAAQLQAYIAEWIDYVSAYNKCYNKLTNIENDKTGKLYYKEAFEKLQLFKNYLDTTVKPWVANLKGNYDFDTGELLPVNNNDDAQRFKSRSSFYDDDEAERPDTEEYKRIPAIDTNFIDVFVTEIKRLNKIMLPSMDTIPEESVRFYSITDYKNKFIKPVVDAIKTLYEGSKPTELDINTQDTLFKYLEEHRKTMQTYQTLLSDFTKNTASIHIKPILMLSNTAGLSYLHDWDGNRLYIDKDSNGEYGYYIMAPLMGAGMKDDNDRFTGVVMGVRELNKIGNKDPGRIGLHGFAANEPSFFLNARDGSAIFGKTGNGQVVIDPSQDKALLYNANYFYFNSLNSEDEENEIGSDGKPTKSAYSHIGESTIRIKSSDYKRHGMLIKFSREEDKDGTIHPPFIHFADAEGRVYSGDHDEVGSSDEGFYLSHNGLSITGVLKNKDGKPIDEEGNPTDDKKKFIKSSITLNTNEAFPKIYSNNHSSINSDKPGFYLGKEGFSILGEVKEEDPDTKEKNIIKSAIILNVNAKSPTIYSNGKSSLKSPENGFYLGAKGLSIGANNKFIINTSGKAIINEEDSTIGNWKINTVPIQIGEDDDGNPIYEDEICLTSTKGGIYMDSENSAIALGSSKGKIYSGEHYKLNSTKKGFYLSQSGMSINNSFKVSQVKDQEGGEIKDTYKLEIGNLNTRHWTIGGVIQDYDTKWNYKLEYVESLYFRNEYTDKNSTFLYSGIFYDTLPGLHIYQGDYISPIEKAPYDPLNPSHDPRFPWNPIAPNCRKTEGDPDYAEKHKEPKYTLTPTSKTNSYIGYGKGAIQKAFDSTYIEEGNYWDVDIDTDIAKKGDVYLGTDGLRLGQGFAVDPENGTAFLKGHIESKSGEIGGWTITKDGLYGKYNRKEVTVKVEKEGKQITEIRVYYYRLEITNKGDICLKYYDNEFNEIKRDDKAKWAYYKLTPHGWHLQADGSFTVIGNSSFFGGVALGGENGTAYDSNYTQEYGPELGVFHGNCHNEILLYITHECQVGGVIYNLVRNGEVPGGN